MKRIKTGFLERRIELAKAGIVSSSSYVTQSALNYMLPLAKREQAQQQLLVKQANYLAAEMGKLKGSVVKIGQMLALYGEYFLPKEITAALHSLEDSTKPLEWASIHGVLTQELGASKLARLDIDESPIASASLSQVHRAYHKDSGETLCLKIQYPGVADAIDADFDAVIYLLKLTSIVTGKHHLGPLLAEIKTLLKQEVNYENEAECTKRIATQFADDSRFVVPRVIDELSTAKVLALMLEEGVSPSDPSLLELPQNRRDQLGKAMLTLFFIETTGSGFMQSDPNFGNFLIRLDPQRQEDKIVLLDFGAMKQLSVSFRASLKRLIKAAHLQDAGGGYRRSNPFAIDACHGSRKSPAEFCRHYHHYRGTAMAAHVTGC